MSDSIVIIPTYNEKENIENIIRAVFGLEKVFHILVTMMALRWDGDYREGLAEGVPGASFYRGA